MENGAKFPSVLFGTKPIGETWKFVKGGVAKGPAVCSIETSLGRFSSTILGLALAEGRLFANQGVRGAHTQCALPPLVLSKEYPEKTGLGGLLMPALAYRISSI